MAAQKPSLPALHKALGIIRTELARVTVAPIPGRERLSAALAALHLKRALNVIKAVLLVSKNGLGSEVGALGRIINEAAFNVMWMLQANDAERSATERERCARDLSDAAALKAINIKQCQADRGFGSKEDAARASKLGEALVARRNGKKPEQHGVEQLARQVGKHAHESYDLFYRTFCMDAHPTLVAAIKAQRGGDPAGHNMNLFMTVAASLVLLQAAYKVMDREEEYGPVDEKVQRTLGIRARVVL